jgi:hypothetical protein
MSVRAIRAAIPTKRAISSVVVAKDVARRTKTSSRLTFWTGGLAGHS